MLARTRVNRAQSRRACPIRVCVPNPGVRAQSECACPIRVCVPNSGHLTTLSSVYYYQLVAGIDRIRNEVGDSGLCGRMMDSGVRAQSGRACPIREWVPNPSVRAQPGCACPAGVIYPSQGVVPIRLQSTECKKKRTLYGRGLTGACVPHNRGVRTPYPGRACPISGACVTHIRGVRALIH
jgi:hypothetical protein